MAVRTSFTAGEVLAAADLTDTFGAKANLASPTFTGTPAAPTAAAGTNTTQIATTAFVQSAGGLVLVTPTSIANSGGSASASGGAVTFTDVSSVSLNGVFTSTYENYRVVISCTSTADDYVAMRLRKTGTDNTTSNYMFQSNWRSGNTSGGTAQTAAYWEIAYGSTTNGSGVADIFSPQVTGTTGINGTGGKSNIAQLTTGFHNVSDTFDGFTLYPPSGTISGKVRVYGYRN